MSQMAQKLSLWSVALKDHQGQIHNFSFTPPSIIIILFTELPLG